MNKAYTRIDWENEPSTNTPINETNLNKMDSALDELDNRVIAQDISKADKTEVSTLISNVEFNESTGIITVTRKNGSVITIDTKMEKIAVNFIYDKNTQQIILTLVDGTKQYIDLSALITQYEFLDSDTITFVVQSDGKIKAEVLDGSITENKLQSNYLAQIKVETAKSETYMNNASSSATQAKSYAVGGTGTREGEDTDNAKYYYQQAKSTDVSQLRQDVDELEYSDVSGGKNIIDLPNPLTISGTWFTAYKFKCKKNTVYTINFNIDSYTVNRGCGIYDNEENRLSDFLYSSGSFNSGNNEELNLHLYSGNATSGTTIYSDIQIEEGTTATPYEPYIPSVKMLSEKVEAQNDSLGDYRLNNVFDGVKQGYITVSTGDESDIDENCVKSIDKKSCKPNDKITIKTEKGMTWIGIAFYEADGTFLSGSEKKDLSKKNYEYTSTAPDNSAYYKYYVGILGEVITPQTVGHIGVYVNNTIDSIKNDLDNTRASWRSLSATANTYTDVFSFTAEKDGFFIYNAKSVYANQPPSGIQSVSNYSLFSDSAIDTYMTYDVSEGGDSQNISGVIYLKKGCTVKIQSKSSYTILDGDVVYKFV